MKLLYSIHQSQGQVFEHLSDMKKFVAVHPVISKMIQNTDGSYRVYETLKLGFIPFSFTYQVLVESRPSENRVIMRAAIKKLIRVEMVFNVKAVNDFTIVEEAIVFKSLLPVASLQKAIFKKQHKQLFGNIEKVK